MSKYMNIIGRKAKKAISKNIHTKIKNNPNYGMEKKTTSGY